MSDPQKSADLKNKEKKMENVERIEIENSERSKPMETNQQLNIAEPRKVEVEKPHNIELEEEAQKIRNVPHPVPWTQV